MKQLLTILTLLSALQVFSQQDTIPVVDYTKVMITTGEDGELYPITSLGETRQAGFFLKGMPNGIVKVCNPEDIYLWVDGRLFDSFMGCRFFDPEMFFAESAKDTIFISIGAENTLEKLTCELVIFEELKVVREEVSMPREVRNEFQEFFTITILLILVIWGVLLSSYPGRVRYIFSRSFSLKISSYEFINTSFFSAPSLYVLVFFSLSLSAVGVYLDTILNSHFFGVQNSAQGFFWSWIQLGAILFALVIAKWLVVSLIAQLFKFRGLKNFQLFDFLNFNTLIAFPILILITLDFILNHSVNSWFGPNFLIVFPICIILYVIWFAFKFVSNSPRKKLMIISYLCATEIIPIILLLGWFYK